MKRPLTLQEKIKQANKLAAMEKEIHSQVAAYIAALKLGEDDRFLAGVELAKQARAQMGIKLSQLNGWLTEGIEEG